MGTHAELHAGIAAAQQLTRGSVRSRAQASLEWKAVNCCVASWPRKGCRMKAPPGWRAWKSETS